MELKIERREENTIAPFINGWNVWNIPEKYWDQSVQDAIIHAYELGAQHAQQDMINEVYRYNQKYQRPTTVEWSE